MKHATARKLRDLMLGALSISLLLLAHPARAAQPDFARLFAGRDACFELYDLEAGKLVVRSGGSRCTERVSPCSTFKVALALMAFDTGLLADERSAMQWDGKDHGLDAWNRDQTATSWIQASVVWFSQRLTTRLGMEKVKDYLARFEFGNQDMSGGLTTAWLSSSLKVSPDEELRFLERLWRGELPVSKHAIEMTRNVTLVGTTPGGWTMHGKTGSGWVDPAQRGQKGAPLLGWFVGHLARGDQELVFVTSYSDRVPPSDDRFGGGVARDLTKEILTTLGFY